MRKFVFIFGLLIIKLSLYSQDSIEKKAIELFDKYSPKIEETNKMVVQYRKAISGDLNNDSLIDVVVEFGLGEKGSNGIIIKQAAIYLNKNDKLKAVAGFEPDYCMNIKKIENGLIYVEELNACSLPWPEIIKLRYYKLVNNELIEVKKE